MPLLFFVLLLDLVFEMLDGLLPLIDLGFQDLFLAFEEFDATVVGGKVGVDIVQLIFVLCETRL